MRLVEFEDKYPIENSFFQAVREERIIDVQKYFENESIFPWKFVESGGYTALHRATYMNSCKLVKLILHEMNRRISSDKIIKFVNKPTDHGFRAIHYASFRGNVDLIKILSENGADHEITTKKGLNVLHVACQGDQPSSLVYFMEKYKLNFKLEDKFGSTPLHWACYSGSDYVIDFCLLLYSDKNDLNTQDKEGLTPLHLSVISDNPKIIKKLLLRGADFTLTDLKARTAYELAKEKKKSRIENELRNYCDRNLIEKIYIKCQSNNKYFYCFSFIFSHLIVELTTICFIFPFIEYTSIQVGYIIIFFFVMILYLTLCVKDPGYLIKSNKETLLQIVESKKKIFNYCPVCTVEKTVNSKHCNCCNKCVDEFDHHCFWVNNCIGTNNLKYFIFFLIILVLNINLNILIGIYGFYISSSNINPVFNLNVPWIVDTQRKNIASLVILIISTIFLFPVAIIFYKNLKNFFHKKTRENSPRLQIQHEYFSSENSSQENLKLFPIKEEDEEDDLIQKL